MNGETLVTVTRQGKTVPIREEGEVHRCEQFAKVPFELANDTRISDGAVRLYIHMIGRYGSRENSDANQNFERRKTMAEALGVTTRTITRRIKELERADWIVVIMQTRKTEQGVGYTSNFYHVFEVQEDCRKFKARNDADTKQREAHQAYSKPRKPRAKPKSKPRGKRKARSS